MLSCGKMHDEKRWKSEQEYFDNVEYSEGPLPANQIERYTSLRKPFLMPEYQFWILGDVRGKRILEIGCGDGSKAVMLALRGATVVGVDISPRAIAVAHERARLHHVEDRAQFYAMPLEAYLEEHREKFDMICAFAFLHHVIPVLDSVLTDLRKLAHERTSFLFVEPVALSKSLRKLRLALPITLNGTPDERPLEPGELDLLRRSFPNLKVRYFNFLVRGWGRVMSGWYEDYSWFKRTLYDTLARLDRILLAIPGMQMIASYAVIQSVPAPARSRACAPAAENLTPSSPSA
jgi:SAM-dependent methyltransferase